jgi:imidazolonepropionase-like amidohydrolase
MTKSIFSLLFALFVGQWLLAQETFPVNGVHDKKPIYYAFTNAHIYKSATEFVENGTLLIKDGKVVSAGAGIQIPAGAVIQNCEGLFIYPSFIDAYAGFNQSSKKEKKEMVPHSHWNPSLHPEFQYNAEFPLKDKLKEDWLASGFGLANIHHRDGIMRGYGQLIHIGIDQPNTALLSTKSAAHYSFARGTSEVAYPTSHIGAVALLRQSFYDADWYMGHTSITKENTPAFDEINKQASAKCIFELTNPLTLRNVIGLEQEFGRKFIVKGTGEEYLLDPTQVAGRIMIVPISFPKPYDVSDPYESRMLSLAQLKHWEAAPFNAYFLDQQGVRIALSRDTIGSSKEFLKNLKQVTESGFDHQKALASLTSIPAEMLGVNQQVGDLNTGKLANFFISNKRFDEAGFIIAQHWNKGQKVLDKRLPDQNLTGDYNLVIGDQNFRLTISELSEKGVKASVKYKTSTDKLKVKVKLDNELVSVVLMTGDSASKLLYQLSGKQSLGGTVWDGKGQDNVGSWVTWAALRDRKSDDGNNRQRDTTKRVVNAPNIMLPNMAYGYHELNTKNTFVITNAKVWTSGPDGFLKNADIYVVDGQIKSIGKDQLYPTELVRINANGKHITPGIIDEHSHLGIFGGANEWGQSSSAEVRISDAVDPWNINIYRHLAGGVTAAQLLHGSANPIGGQSALIEMKWGQSADEMLIDNAPGHIKFALGENVKRSNSNRKSDRFPETRMGVEQTFADAFIRAKEYSTPESLAEDTKRKNKENIPNAGSVRRDLELDAITEILNDTRYISCHSYVQSEILMLMNLGDSLGFRVNTFTHILEGYKVAKEMAAHGANGSTFADWWAYKFEVKDAIPYNAALMQEAGVNVGINSDDAEMGRRLNQEAAKTVKYGGVSEEDALKMITINPAKMLHLDDRMGSIEVGKQANLVIWSDHPLSVYSHPEKTLINGVTYYDALKAADMQTQIARERARLIALMLSDKSANKQKPKAKEEKHYHCDTLLDNYWEE